jgi:hypothetical protein
MICELDVNDSNELAALLIKNDLVKSFLIREKICNYYDIVPRLNLRTLNSLITSTSLHIGGKGFNLSTALGSCAGEVIERISLKNKNAHYDEYGEFPHSKYMSKKIIKKLNLSDLKKTKLIRMDGWKSKQHMLIPINWVYFSTQRGAKTMRSSVGTAFNSDKNTAIRSAILELIERHSFLYCWYTSIPIIGLCTNKKISTLIRPFERKLNATIKFYLLRSNIKIPVYMCVIDSKAGLAFGLSCKEKSFDALKHALAEALQVYVSFTFLEDYSNADSKNSSIIALFNIKNNFPLKIKKSTTPMKDFKLTDTKLQFYYKDIIYPKFSNYGHVIRAYSPKLIETSPLEFPIFNTTYGYAAKFRKLGRQPFI